MSPHSSQLSVCVLMCANCEGGSLMAVVNTSKLFTNTFYLLATYPRHHVSHLSLQLTLILGWSSGHRKKRKEVSFWGLVHKSLPRESPFSFSFPVYLLHMEFHETLNDYMKFSLPPPSIFPSHQPTSDSDSLIFIVLSHWFGNYLFCLFVRAVNLSWLLHLLLSQGICFDPFFSVVCSHQSDLLHFSQTIHSKWMY